jgi:hypothetical protein
MMADAMRVLLFRTMRDIVLRFRPDVIISTYPLYQAPLNALFTLRWSFVPVVCVVTDLATVHQIWFTRDADLTVVPTGIVRDLALAAGVPDDRVEIIGIPVSPRIAQDTRDKERLRAELGWKSGLVTLLAGLNAGRDLDGLPLTTKTSFCIGSRINPGAQDAAAEVARAKAEVQAGAQFLVTRPVYELGALSRMVEALADSRVPVLLSVSPLRSFEEADYLAHEVPEVTIPAGTLRALDRAGRRAARETGLRLSEGLLREGRPLVDGVLLTAGHGDAAALAPLLATVTSDVESGIQQGRDREAM